MVVVGVVVEVEGPRDAVADPGVVVGVVRQGLEGDRTGQEKGQDASAEALDADEAQDRQQDGQDDQGLEFQGHEEGQHDPLELTPCWNEKILGVRMWEMLECQKFGG